MLAKRKALRRHRKIVTMLAALFSYGLALSGVAWASGDSSCSPSWKLAAHDYGCGGRAMISPGNDTRINLLLLMRSLKPPARQDAAPAIDNDDPQFGRSFMSWKGMRAAFWPKPPSAAQEYGNAPSCLPPAEAVSSFNAALTAETGVTQTERNSLRQLRTQVGCGDVKWSEAAVTSMRGREYLAYLKAAAAFHENDWAAAQQGFAALTRSRSRWIAETAKYMPIRIGMRAAVAKAVNEYGDFAGSEKVDPAGVTEARDAIAAYLKAYPKGRYAASAQGLTRRVAWLSGDTAALARAYEKLLVATSGDDEFAADLAEEIDLKLLEREDVGTIFGRVGDTPLLLAIADLKQMRREENGPLAFTAEELSRQKSQFSNYGEMYTLLAGSRAYYAGESPSKILSLIPDAARARNFTPLAFSRQMLRGMALSRANDPNEAGFWKEMLGGASPLYQRPLIEIGLAVRWQREGKLAQIFAPDSPVTDAAIREILLQTIATPAILRTAVSKSRPAHERDVARFTLLYKGLTHGGFADFGSDIATIPPDANYEAGLWDFAYQGEIPLGLFNRGKWSDGFPCPAIAQTAAALARAPRDARALLCLGDFYRLNGFDGFGLFPATKDADALGYGPDGFPGKAMPRSDIYDAIIANRQAAANERAYALYRAVMCYSPSGYNGCSGAYTDGAAFDAAQAPKARRKAWFVELKQRYPDSEWAKSLQYYW